VALQTVHDLIFPTRGRPDRNAPGNPNDTKAPTIERLPDPR
jgi:hypothetical protein